MCLNNFFGYWKTKTGAFLVTASWRVWFIESVPDFINIFFGNSAACILNRYLRFLALFPDCYVYVRIFFTELNGVVYKIIYNLLDSALVCLNILYTVSICNIEFNALLLACSLECLNSVSDYWIKVKGWYIKSYWLRIEFIKSKNITCQLSESFGLKKHYTYIFIKHFRWNSSILDSFQISLDRSKRRSEVVRYIRQELLLEFIWFIKLWSHVIKRHSKTSNLIIKHRFNVVGKITFTVFVSCPCDFFNRSVNLKEI